MFIGELESHTGTDKETIRFYERIELISSPNRRDSGYREFSEQHIEELIFIQEAKKLGFTLKETKELLALKIDDSNQCQAIRSKAENKLSTIQQKIASLERMEKVLQDLIERCKADQSKVGNECVILESLKRKENE